MRKLLLSSLFLLTVCGCTYENGEESKATTRPADAALKDPYGKWSKIDPEMQDISGGGTRNLNRDALKRDVDNFLLK